ncbi:hypothetical protein ACFU99_06700 [Streptomyces sp. NPDC057654]|uniref:hypothetical protein n=1 Tax=Streptomyces sp. NPDC057654 TaxID=3346196 RepID=UPI0036B96E87
MGEFDSGQVDVLLGGPRFVDEPVERLCPACGKQSVRTYVHRQVSGARKVRITYSWCASCRRFKGWTGPDLGDLEFSDPLGSFSAQERSDMQKNFDDHLRTLDELWERGRLPQKFRATH